MMKTTKPTPYHYRLALLTALVSCYIATVQVQELHARDTPHQEFRLTAEELKPFEGYYQFQQNSNAYIQVKQKDNGLLAIQLWDEKEFFIVPKSALEFYSKKAEFPAKFSKDNSGKVTQVVVFNKDTWKRVDNYSPPKDITLSADKLKSYEGKYRFQFEPGTDAFIQITAYADHLILTEQWSGDKVRFSPQSEVDFYSKERAFPLKFTRDKSGVVTHVLAFNRDLWTKVQQ